MDELISKNIILRKAKLSDLEALFKNIWSDERIAAFLIWQPIYTIDEAKERLVKNIEWQKSNYSYIVALKETDEAIGYAGVKEVNKGIFQDAGLCLATKYQGFGYGKELLNLLLDLVFNKLNASAFIYGCMSHNEKSKRLCARFGFEYFESNQVVRPWDNFIFIDDRHLLTKEKYHKGL